MLNAGSNTGTGIMPQPGAPLLGNVAYMPPGFEGWYKEPFSYNIFYTSIANGITTTGTAAIQNDSYFVCTQQMAEIWDAATGNTTNIQPNASAMLVKITDSSSGKANMDQPTPLSAQFGTASQPKVWLYRAKLYLPGGQISCDVTNNHAAAQRVRLVFEGFKVYRVPDNLNQM